ncbi:hypothetical protein ANSO36C_21960 [Nostoc cf. commune SO-36]|uniref:Response regulatory domain-containing protein n=1 Tax=Nostoc cf. commune SO-36 TaxID=449208 RepID=A0ABM7Z0J5_NOSCO|nr:hypothetical protein ANSO36C_21960 [Nostoc cf. commune SO-36]
MRTVAARCGADGFDDGGYEWAEATRAIRKKYPEIQVLILTSFLANDLVQKAIQAGAISYLLKGISIDELANAIRAAAIGRSMLAGNRGNSGFAATKQTFIPNCL